MNFQNHVHFSARQTAGFEVRQQLRRRRVSDLPGGKILWLAVAKVFCISLIVICGSGLWFGSTTAHINTSIETVEANLHSLRNDQIALLAERARLMSAKNIHTHAQQELALYVPEKGQVYKIR